MKKLRIVWTMTNDLLIQTTKLQDGKVSVCLIKLHISLMHSGHVWIYSSETSHGFFFLKVDLWVCGFVSLWSFVFDVLLPTYRSMFCVGNTLKFSPCLSDWGIIPCGGARKFAYSIIWGLSRWPCLTHGLKYTQQVTGKHMPRMPWGPEAGSSPKANWQV